MISWAGQNRATWFYSIDEQNGWTEQPHDNTQIAKVAFRRNERELIYQASNYNDPFLIQNYETGEIVHRIETPLQTEVQSFGLSASERYFFFFTYDRDLSELKLHVFDVAQRQAVGTTTAVDYKMTNMNAHFSSDDRYLFMAHGSTLRVFNLKNLRLEHLGSESAR